MTRQPDHVWEPVPASGNLSDCLGTFIFTPLPPGMKVVQNETTDHGNGQMTVKAWIPGLFDFGPRVIR